MSYLILLIVCDLISFQLTSGKRFSTSGDDPHVEEEGKFNVSLPPLLEIYRDSNHTGYRIAGLSTMDRDQNFDVLTLSFEFRVTVKRLNTSGKAYFVAGWIDSTPLREETLFSGDFVGSGDYFRFSITKFVIDGRAQITLKGGNHISISELEVNELSFNAVNVDLGPNFKVDNDSINWEDFTKNFKPNFDEDFVNKKDGIVEKLRRVANNIIEKYTLTEFLELANEKDPMGAAWKFAPQHRGSERGGSKTKDKKKKSKKSQSLPLMFDALVP